MILKAYSNSVKRSFLFWMGAALVLHLVAAWYSIGFLHYDEHFQILEFASAKLGWISKDTLPWEYGAKIRPALQPAMVCGLIRLFHLQDPFLIAFWLRIISGILGWIVLCIFTYVVSLKLESDKAKRNLFILTAAFAFLSVIHAHFSSESMAGTMCFAAISLLLICWDGNYSAGKKTWLYLTCGFLFGLSYLFRMQVAIIPAGIIIWALLTKKINIRGALMIICGGLLALALGVLTDRWFYGEWVNTAYNYFHVNIVENVASHFGSMPPYWFIQEIVFNKAFILGLVLVSSFFYYWIRFSKSVITWISLPFFIIHCLIAHKELRFLFPLVDVIPFMVILLFNDLNNVIGKVPLWFKKYFPVLGYMAVFIYFAPFVLIPAWSKDFEIYKFINDNYKGQAEYIVGYHHKPYNLSSDLILKFNKKTGPSDTSKDVTLVPAMVNFYIPKVSRLFKVDNSDSLKNIIRNAGKPVLVYVSQKGFIHPSGFDSIPMNYTLKYCTAPMLMKNNDFNHWQERTSTLALYE